MVIDAVDICQWTYTDSSTSLSKHHDIHNNDNNNNNNNNNNVQGFLDSFWLC